MFEQHQITKTTDVQNDFLKYTPDSICTMNKTALLVPGLLFLLIVCVLSTGCTENSSTANTTPQTSLVTTAPSTAARYIAGDIVRIPNSSSVTAILIMGYNPATDMYERVLIYPNADSSWGYRVDNRTEPQKRAVLEKVYTEKITNKPPASIVIRQPTVLTTTTTTKTSTATTTNVSRAGKPTFKKIDPDYGTAGTAISITALTGTNFQSGATVKLMKLDNPNITATNVNVQSPILMTLTFTPPSNATAGAWDVVITNPDGQYVNYANIFSIHAPVGTTTTTSSTGDGITSISPTSMTAPKYVEMTILGSNFQIGIKGKLTKSTDTNINFPAQDCRRDLDTKVTCWFNVPIERRGTWNIILTNPDGTTRTLLNGFEVK